jgi:hypothetical protein
MSENLRERTELRHAVPLLLVVEGLDTISAALVREGGEGEALLGALRIPRGGSIDALGATLAASAGLSGSAEQVRGGVAEAAIAAGRLAERLGVPIRVVEVEGDASRMLLAGTDRSTFSFEVTAAALVPLDPTERRRRADGVLALLGRTDRSAISDALGDLADAPLRDRDDEREVIRAAATADALRRLGEALSGEDLGEAETDAAPLLVVGSAASLIATGALPLTVLAPLIVSGRTRVLLEPYGVFAALGDSALDDDRAASLLGALMSDLPLPGGDLLLLDGGTEDQVTLQIDGEAQAFTRDSSLVLPLRSGELAEVEIRASNLHLHTQIHGGISRAALIYGDAQLDLSADAQGTLSAAAAAAVTAAPIPAPIQILPTSGGVAGHRSARLLLGDAVDGHVHFSDAEPDAEGWEAARAAGLLAIVQASPETVLRARAVGVRGVIVCGLSDGERDALAASLERRIAAAVATEPFGLLIMTSRRMSQSGRSSAAALLRSLHGGRVTFSAEPIGLLMTSASVLREASAAQAGDVRVIGGAYEGASGTWEGLADPRADDPLGAVRIGGVLRAIPLGDLQRITA